MKAKKAAAKKSSKVSAKAKINKSKGKSKYSEESMTSCCGHTSCCS